jgi:hypothetical protein
MYPEGAMVLPASQPQANAAKTLRPIKHRTMHLQRNFVTFYSSVALRVSAETSQSAPRSIPPLTRQAITIDVTFFCVAALE